jgi:hypothetical protein
MKDQVLLHQHPSNCPRTFDSVRFYKLKDLEDAFGGKRVLLAMLCWIEDIGSANADTPRGNFRCFESYRFK